jgi:hypothetical protein
LQQIATQKETQVCGLEQVGTEKENQLQQIETEKRTRPRVWAGSYIHCAVSIQGYCSDWQ